MPILHIHSVDDPRALYKGGEGPPFPMTKNTIHHPNLEQVLAQWTEFNGCSNKTNPIMVKTEKNSLGHTGSLYNYGTGKNGASVFHWKLTGAGHVWPSKNPNRKTSRFIEKYCGSPSDVIDANEEMWQFFDNVLSQ